VGVERLHQRYSKPGLACASSFSPAHGPPSLGFTWTGLECKPGFTWTGLA